MTDRQLQQSVLQELDFEPGVRASDIGVAIHHGVVTLSGFVESYVEKFEAEHVAQRVFGVKAVANDLEVKLPDEDRQTDPEIAEAAVRALDSAWRVPKERIQITVRDGVVILEGTVDWKYQSAVAEEGVRRLRGVRSVRNRVTVKPHVSTPDVRNKIEEALTRAAEVDARRITVEAMDGTVIPRGNVHSWHERTEAVNAAGRAPGVTQVEDRLVVAA